LIKIVKFSHTVFDQEDHIFVSEDPARIYRGLKDLLVDEFDIDRIEEGHMEFNVSKPKKTESGCMHLRKKALIPYYISNYRLRPRHREMFIWLKDLTTYILKARVAVKAKVVTVYPGGEPLTWVPEAIKEGPVSTISKTGLKSEHITDFQRSKLYKILVGIWYNTILFTLKRYILTKKKRPKKPLSIYTIL